MDRSLLRVVKALGAMGALEEREPDESYRVCFQRVAPRWLESDAADAELRDYVEKLLEREVRRHPKTDAAPEDVSERSGPR